YDNIEPVSRKTREARKPVADDQMNAADTDWKCSVPQGRVVQKGKRRNYETIDTAQITIFITDRSVPKAETFEFRICLEVRG
ncbi:MAG: hypothetical protein ACWGQW_14760, partial [bacterium]